MHGCCFRSSLSVFARVVGLILGFAGVLGTPSCSTVEQTLSPTSKVRRPVEVTYRFENVRRTSAVDEWVLVRSVLEKHSSGSVTVRYENERKYESAEIRDYVAKCVLRDVGDVKDVQNELESLSRQSVGGQQIRFAMMTA